MKKSPIAGASAFAMIASLLAMVAPAANAALNVPKSAWPACSSSRTVYCVEAVSVTTVSGNKIALSWVADGATLQPVETSTASTVSDTATVTSDTSTVTSDTSTANVPTVTIPTLATGRAVAGRWTSTNWSTEGLDLLGYGGLYVEAKTANEFVNHIFINTLPTITSSANKVNIANQPGNSNFTANLDNDLTIEVTVKVGEVKPGVLVSTSSRLTPLPRACGSVLQASINRSAV
jgi:hypothetical protein